MCSDYISQATPQMWHVTEQACFVLQLSQQPAIAIRSSIAFNLAAPMTGDPNRDFALQMAAHHMVSRQASLYMEDIPSNLMRSITRDSLLCSSSTSPIAQRQT